MVARSAGAGNRQDWDQRFYDRNYWEHSGPADRRYSNDFTGRHLKIIIGLGDKVTIAIHTASAWSSGARGKQVDKLQDVALQVVRNNI
jgi:hypothetical protein